VFFFCLGFFLVADGVVVLFFFQKVCLGLVVSVLVQRFDCCLRLLWVEVSACVACLRGGYSGMWCDQNG